MTDRRCFADGEILHVTDRGTRGEPLFVHPGDRGYWLACLGAACEANAVEALHFCLMTNHTHLIVRSVEGDLPAAMWQLKTTYANRLRWRHGVEGTIFARRYFARRIREERHLLAAMRYVSDNPVSAGLARDARDYRWSAHRSLVGDVVAPPGLAVRTAESLCGGRMNLLAALIDTRTPAPAPASQPLGRPRRLEPGAAIDLVRAEGLTQREAAERLGVSQASVSRALRRPDVDAK